MVNFSDSKLSVRLYNSVVLIIFSITLNAQVTFENDTIKINEVIIKSKKTASDLSGFKKIIIDSSTVNDFTHESLAELLMQNSNIFIKSYGAGGSATTSFRGTGAGHTQLQWNNININNPMLGQPDLSLIPAGLIDEIDIYYGGSSMPYGIGGIGGMINLETKPMWRNKTIITINPGIGSFNQYSGLVKLRTGNLNFQSVTKAYLQFAENNFSYLNTVSSSEPVWEIRKNNQTAQQGFLQELYYRKSKNVLSARLWYQSADRTLPSSMLISQPDNNEKQHDESIRTIINYDGYSGMAEYFITGSFSVSELDYSNKLASIDSRNLSKMMILRTGLVNRLGELVQTKVAVENENTLVNSENYDNSKARRNVASLTATAEVNGSGRFVANFLFREIIHNNSFLIPDISTGFQFRIAENRYYYLKANYSRNSKLPSMNDLYWYPGGNPSLLNESANMFEFIYEMNQKISSGLLLKFDISLYHNAIKNMIQWLPGDYSYWVADNIKSVNTAGMETAASFNYKINKTLTTLNLNYTYTKATTTGSDISYDESVGKQLVYVPVNKLNTILKITFLNLYSYWICDFTGRRYTKADNTSFLPAYIINSLSVGYTFNHSDNMFNASISSDNIFNTNYETIAYYPQPGRSFSLKLLIQFSK